jgi:aerobic-type carbon monoxide dehydrogenase small subunit (CoxS/CutS family)
MLASAYNIVTRRADEDHEIIRKEFSNKLCRCMECLGIVQAIEAASIRLDPDT